MQLLYLSAVPLNATFLLSVQYIIQESHYVLDASENIWVSYYVFHLVLNWKAELEKRIANVVF